MSPAKVGEQDGLPSTTVEAEGGEFVVSKVLSQKGEKLEVKDVVNDAKLRLDALALESLSWQPSSSSLARVLDLPTAAVAAPDAATATDEDECISVSNEYAICTVRKLVTDDEEYLEIASESGDSSSVFTGAALAALASFSNEFALSDEFRSPFGPERKRQFDAPF